MLCIPVDTYPIDRKFPSFEAAIKDAMRYSPLAEATAAGKLVEGTQIIDGFWTDTDFVLRFSNGRHLHVSVPPISAGRTVLWRVLDAEPAIPGEVQRVGSPPVTLDFPRIGPWVMDRSALLAARRGRPFRMFFVSELAFHVYTRKQSILTFGCVRRRDTGDNLLYVCEDD